MTLLAIFIRASAQTFLATAQGFDRIPPAHKKIQERRNTSQRSLHHEPIFRLLLKVAVKGTQQCEFLKFYGVYIPI